MTSLKFDDFKTLLDRPHVYGRYIAGMCPFESHKNQALLVFSDGYFNCLGCARHGSWKTLWNKLKGQNVIVRADTKTSWAGPRVEGDLETATYQAHIDLTRFSSFGWYLEERGLQNRIDMNEIGYMEGWYTIPVFAENGSFVTTVFRSLPHVQKASNLRYVCRHVPVPFVPDWNKLKTAKQIFVVYGIFDALTLAELGFPVMTSSSGKNTFNAEWLESYRKRIVILPDQGEEEQAHQLCSAIDFTRGKVVELEFPKGKKDVNGFFEAGRRSELLYQLTNI